MDGWMDTRMHASVHASSCYIFREFVPRFLPFLQIREFDVDAFALRCTRLESTMLDDVAGGPEGDENLRASEAQSQRLLAEATRESREYFEVSNGWSLRV